MKRGESGANKWPIVSFVLIVLGSGTLISGMLAESLTLIWAAIALIVAAMGGLGMAHRAARKAGERAVELGRHAPLGSVPSHRQQHANTDQPHLSQVVLELAARRGWWGSWSLLLFLGSAVFAAITLGFFLFAFEEPPMLIFGTLFGGIAIVSGLAAKAGYSIARSTPKLIVRGDELILHDPGLFNAPITVTRGQVHRIYIVPSEEVDEPPSQRRSLWGRTKAWMAYSEETDWPTEKLPLDSAVHLSSLFSWQAPDLLIVLRTPLAMGPWLRRGVGCLSWVTWYYAGPTRSTFARGLFACTEEPALAAQAFSSWPAAHEPERAIWQWLRGDERI